MIKEGTTSQKTSEHKIEKLGSTCIMYVMYIESYYSATYLWLLANQYF